MNMILATRSMALMAFLTTLFYSVANAAESAKTKSTPLAKCAANFDTFAEIQSNIEQTSQDLAQGNTDDWQEWYQMHSMVRRLGTSSTLTSEYARGQKLSDISYVYLIPMESEQMDQQFTQILKFTQSSVRFAKLAPKFLDLQTRLKTNNLYGTNATEDQLVCLSNDSKKTIVECQENNPECSQGDLDALADKVLVEEVILAAEKVANDEETLWADTILEGPYELAGQASAVEIKYHKYRDMIFAYSMTISAPAFFIDDCRSYNSDESSQDEDCPSVTIRSRRMMDWQFKDIELEHLPDAE
jgi:hypothetical protein